MGMRQLERGRVFALRPLVACLAIALSLGTNASAKPAGVAAPASATTFADLAPDQPTSIYLVENCNDAGQGSLRDAVNSANMAGVDATIKFDLNAMGCSTISLKTGEIGITISNLTIQGPDPDVVTIDGGYAHGYLNRIFKHTGQGTLQLDHLVLTDAKYETNDSQQANGGCVSSSGTANLTHSTLSECRAVTTGPAQADGGAIWATGIALNNSAVTDSKAIAFSASADGGGITTGVIGITAIDSTITDNAAISYSPNADSRGGGAHVGGPGVFERSTVSGNNAYFAGGLYTAHSAALADSTISGNSANRYGAASIHQNIRIYNSTISDNTASANGYVAGVYAASIYAVSSLIAQNVNINGGGVVDLDVRSGDGQVTGSHNLIMAADMSTTLPPDTHHECPRLGALLGNGGPTHTQALLPASPAIEAGDDPFDLGVDQRGTGFPRVIGAHADIGAYEWSATSGDEINRSGFELCE